RLIASFSVADIPWLYRWRWACLNLIGPADPGGDPRNPPGGSRPHSFVTEPWPYWPGGATPPGTPPVTQGPIPSSRSLGPTGPGGATPCAPCELWFEPWSAPLWWGRLR